MSSTLSPQEGARGPRHPAMRKSELSASRRWLVERMQQLGFGRIKHLVIANGEPVLNPVSPTPIYPLNDGRYILFMQNHDGYGYGGRGPLDLDARRPQFFVVGEFRPDAHQPIWFSRPKLIFDTQCVGVFPFYKKWLSMYASFTEHNGKRILWYADRKIFVLGRYITDDMLADMSVPR